MRDKFKLTALSPLIRNLLIQAFKNALVLLHLQLKTLSQFHIILYILWHYVVPFELPSRTDTSFPLVVSEPIFQSQPSAYAMSQTGLKRVNATRRSSSTMFGEVYTG